MKRLILALAIVSVAGTAFARGNGPAGCGLGTAVVFKRPSAWWQHVLAASTNQTSGNQTFGMTSGTLGCQSARGPLAGVQSFMDDNLGQLAVETAQGQGETLDALSHLIGIKAADKPHFNQTLQANFDKVFSAETTSGDAHKALTEILAQDNKLKKYLG